MGTPDEVYNRASSIRKNNLSKNEISKKQNREFVFLWDLRSVKEKYKKNELFFTANRMPSSEKLWVCFDEIHKVPKWKNILKGIFDTTYENYNFIITGSAKFDITRRAGDSLAGRYFTFHLFPLCLSELINAKSLSEKIPKNPEDFINQRIDSNKNGKGELSLLLEYSGFPEPFLKQSQKFHSKWATDYIDTVIKEDVSSLTKIIERENLYDLYSLLPEMVSSPISESSLASHLELSSPTIKNYLKHLENFHLTFRIYPYSKNIKRSLLKAAKCYLYDWTRIKDPGKRFENFVAVELMTQINLWMENSGESYSLFYIRNKQKLETDFLITKNSQPWLLIEAKLSDSNILKHHSATQKVLGNVPFIQICRESGICMIQKPNCYRISASRFFV